jgi:short-subunit dehydrogenase
MAASDGSCAAIASSSSSSLWVGLYMALAFPTVFWLVCYLIPQIYMCLRPVPNLKRQYQATWALVTGGGSGIGKAIAFQLAAQELNVVIVSLDDDFLKGTLQELRAAYPQLEFRSVGVNFTPGVDYMEQIVEATKDIEIPIIFNNAGFIVTGFVDQAPIGKLLTNMECNATSAVQISHHFIRPLIAAKKKGCLVFTSSVAAYMPSPFAALYSSTKAFVSTLAYSMHIELKPLGIDVVSIHPSPVASNFYEKLDHKVDLIEAAAKNAVAPQAIVQDIFRSVGAGCASRDLGALAWGTRIGTFFIPHNAFCALFATAAPYLPDWKTHNKNR